MNDREICTWETHTHTHIRARIYKYIYKRITVVWSALFHVDRTVALGDIAPRCWFRVRRKRRVSVSDLVYLVFRKIGSRGNVRMHILRISPFIGRASSRALSATAENTNKWFCDHRRALESRECVAKNNASLRPANISILLINRRYSCAQLIRNNGIALNKPIAPKTYGGILFYDVYALIIEIKSKCARPIFIQQPLATVSSEANIAIILPSVSVYV